VETVFVHCSRLFANAFFQWSESALPLTGKRQRQDATTGAFATVAGVGQLPTPGIFWGKRRDKISY